MRLFLCQSQVGVECLKTQGGVGKTLDKPESDFCTYLTFLSFSFYIFKVGILISPPHGVLLSIKWDTVCKVLRASLLAEL